MRPAAQRRRFENAGEARFLTFSCNHRLPLFDNDRIKDAFVEALDANRAKSGFRLLGWVIMPEHVHLLVIPRLPEKSVSDVLRDFKGGFAQRVLHRWRQFDAPVLRLIVTARGGYRFWLPGGGYDVNILGRDRAVAKLEYMHGNPIVRGLVRTPTAWKWSSARWYAGERGPDVLRMDPLE